jgi:hypothetical protein
MSGSLAGVGFVIEIFEAGILFPHAIHVAEPF